MQVTASGSYVWASTRGTAGVGYLNAFALAENGSISEHLFTLPSPTGGAQSNSVSPAFFDDQWVAVAEKSNMSVQIWHFDAANKTAEIVATWYSTSDCCANAVWYS